MSQSFNSSSRRVVYCAALAAVCLSAASRLLAAPPDNLLAGKFAWQVSAPLVSPAARPADPCISVKDPSIVRYDGRWHLFCTIRSQKRSHQVEYLSFADWSEANAAPRHVLKISGGYFCAPQVFYFSPHKLWYMALQVAAPDRKEQLQPAVSTTTDIADPASWSKPRLIFDAHPANVSAWIDFWVVCDEERAHLFFTSLNGLLWRCDTRLADFPTGFSEPKVVLRDDIFEASHTYRLKGLDKYLTLVEAQNGSRRYYKAYLADRLDGEWRPLAATREAPFASPLNARHAGESWTDSYSHGELLRTGHDERLEVDPENLQFLFQGVSDREMAGKPYGEIPWRLGLLTPER